MNRRRRKRTRKVFRFFWTGGTVIFLVLAVLAGTHFVRTGEKIGKLVSAAAKEPGEDSLAEADASENAASSQEDDWRLLLVNRKNKIPENYQVELTELAHNQAVDSRIYPDLQAMFDAARAEGIDPTISSSYRTTEDQRQEMEEKIGEYLDQGYDRQEAEEMAEDWVALPGTSEHEIGMAVDITTGDWEVQDASVVWDWMNENSYRYGFIQRYPEDKKEITGVSHEPWHYRYVGPEAAREIHDQGVCLEEYLHRE